MSTWPTREFKFGPPSKPKKLGRPGVAKHRHFRGAGMIPAVITGSSGQVRGPISWSPASIFTPFKGVDRNENRQQGPVIVGKGKCRVIGHRPLDKWGWCSRCREQVAPPEEVSV